MIPKKIHYCWFGGKEKGKKEKACIASWKKFCPDFEILEWNENNFDLSDVPEFVKTAYENKNFAYVSDYVRLAVLYKHGGVYMDTDVEVIRNLSGLLNSSAFFGFEDKENISSALMSASEIGHPCIKAMMDVYEKASFFNEDGSKNMLACSIVNTQVLEQFGLNKNGKEQLLQANIHIYPCEYFNPYDSETDILNISANTYSIHWYTMSWLSPAKRFRNKLMRPVYRLFRR